MHHLLIPQGLPADVNALKHSSVTPSPELSDSIRALPSDLLSLYQDLPEGDVSAKENPDLAFKMHMLLSRLDPEMSDRWHWRDTRKVLRNLEIIKEQGIPASKAIRNAFVAFTPRPYVCSCPMLTYLNLPITPSYDVLLFWLHADKDVLEPRLDERVDEMLEVSAFAVPSI